EELGGQRYSAMDRLEVAWREVEEHVRLPVRSEDDAALALVLDQRRRGQQVVVLPHPGGLLLAHAGQRPGEQAGRHRGVAAPDALLAEMVDMEGLVGPDPRVERAVEEAYHLRVGMGVEAAPDRARAEPAPLQDARGVPRAGGQHDQWRVGAEAAARPARVVDEAAAHAGR